MKKNMLVTQETDKVCLMNTNQLKVSKNPGMILSYTTALFSGSRCPPPPVLSYFCARHHPTHDVMGMDMSPLRPHNSHFGCKLRLTQIMIFKADNK